MNRAVATAGCQSHGACSPKPGPSEEFRISPYDHHEWRTAFRAGPTAAAVTPKLVDIDHAAASRSDSRGRRQTTPALASTARAGIEIRFTGHSPRRGLATSSRMKGYDQIVIVKQGGWAPHSKVLAGYLEVVDQWEDNVLLGVL